MDKWNAIFELDLHKRPGHSFAYKRRMNCFAPQYHAKANNGGKAATHFCRGCDVRRNERDFKRPRNANDLNICHSSALQFRVSGRYHGIDVRGIVL